MRRMNSTPYVRANNISFVLFQSLEVRSCVRSLLLNVFVMHAILYFYPPQAVLSLAVTPKHYDCPHSLHVR
ncbi:hypothetical protein C0J52_14749 [Blattella germanica]|nr:hypothetical protein C0J52_14749 [Blattella germanica]